MIKTHYFRIRISQNKPRGCFLGGYVRIGPVDPSLASHQPSTRVPVSHRFYFHEDERFLEVEHMFRSATAAKCFAEALWGRLEAPGLKLVILEAIIYRCCAGDDGKMYGVGLGHLRRQTGGLVVW